MVENYLASFEVNIIKKLTVLVEETSQKTVRWVEKRLSDSSSLLSIPGLIAGSVAGTTANKADREKCEYADFEDYAVTQKTNISGLTTEVDQIKANIKLIQAELSELPDMENRMSKNSLDNCEVLAEEIKPKFPSLEKSLEKRIDIRV